MEPFYHLTRRFARNNGRKQRRRFSLRAKPLFWGKSDATRLTPRDRDIRSPIFFSPDGCAFVPRHAAGYFV
jgi:hypothetical protein